MARINFTSGMFVAVLMSVSVAHSAEIKLSADVWCPYNCEPDSADKPGTMIEIARHAFEPADKVVYSTLPWSRAIEVARTGEIDGIIGAITEDAPDFVFPSEPLGASGDSLISRKADSWTFSGWESLKGRRLASVKDYEYGGEVAEYLNKAAEADVVSVVGGDEPLQKLVPMLLGNRIDAFVENHDVAAYFAKSSGNDNNLTISPPIGQSFMFIALSPKKAESADRAKKLSDTMVKLRASGELAKILEKYGLKDWK